MSQLGSHSKILESSKLAAKSAGLVYVSDEKPGITRKHAGKTFHYFSPTGKRITDEETLYRIRQLAIPPAWTEVWISPSDRGHIQAVGRDRAQAQAISLSPAMARDARRDEVRPHARVRARAAADPQAREARPRPPGLPREKVLATVVAADGENAHPRRQRRIRASTTIPSA